MILVSPEFLYRFEHIGAEHAVSRQSLSWPRACPISSGRSAGCRAAEARTGRQSAEGGCVEKTNRAPAEFAQANALSENFGGQWLGFGELMANREYLLNERWNRETYDEALFFFDELIRSNRSVLGWCR